MSVEAAEPPAAVSVPDEFHDLDFEAKIAALTESNSGVDLREAVNDLVGLSNGEIRSNNYPMFKKRQLAVLLMALGGPGGS